MKKKRVYTFGNGAAEGRADMRNLLGGKGANLAEMNHIGVPVPPGFTITTEVCSEYNEKGKEYVISVLKDEVEQAIKLIEELTGTKFGDNENPCLVSFRCQGIDARYDGHRAEPGVERWRRGRYC